MKSLAAGLALALSLSPTVARSDEPQPAPAAVVAAPPAPPPAKPKPPVTQRPWFWGVVGGAVVVGVAAVVIGVTLTQDTTRTLPAVSF